MFLMGLLTPTMIVIRSYNEVNVPTVTLLAKTLRAVRQQKLQITSWVASVGKLAPWRDRTWEPRCEEAVDRSGAIRSLFQLMGRDTAYWYRRGRGCLWAKAGCRLGTLGWRVESKRVDKFAQMTDEELRQYIYGDKELDS